MSCSCEDNGLGWWVFLIAFCTLASCNMGNSNEGDIQSLQRKVRSLESDNDSSERKIRSLESDINRMNR